jgi:hypothetical protein
MSLSESISHYLSFVLKSCRDYWKLNYLWYETEPPKTIFQGYLLSLHQKATFVKVINGERR